jgi:hypothetical protein
MFWFFLFFLLLLLQWFLVLPSFCDIITSLLSHLSFQSWRGCQFLGLEYLNEIKAWEVAQSLA